MQVKDLIIENLEEKEQNRIFPFFWLHGSKHEEIFKVLKAVYDSGIRSICLESRPHPDYLGPGWWSDLDFILKNAEEMGMKIWLLDDQHFPTGYAAGAVLEASDELSHLYLDHNVLMTHGPVPCAQIDVNAWGKPQPLPPWIPSRQFSGKKRNKNYVLDVVALPILKNGRKGEPISLLNYLNDGIIEWDIPSGYWSIEIIYITHDAHGRNDYINMLDRDSCRLLIDTVYEPHYERYSEYFGNVIVGFFSDEPPIGNTPGYTRGDFIGKKEMPLPWCDEIPNLLEESFGHDWKSFLPLLWSDGEEFKTANIRVAYMDIVSNLVAKNFSQQIGNWCESRGVKYIGHLLEDCDASSGLGPSLGHFFRGMSGQHMSGIDNIGGQVLPGGQNIPRRPMLENKYDTAAFYHYMLGRMGASLAAIDPKKKGRSVCEIFGAYGWASGLKDQKYMLDHFLVRGINHFVPHAFTEKTYPDPDCPPHFYAFGHNPQFHDFKYLMKYTNRMCNLIRSGQEVNQVALLYHAESQWAGDYESNVDAARILGESQYNYLLIPSDVFKKNHRFEFYEGQTIYKVNGVQVQALIISGSEYLNEESAKFIAEAIRNNFPIIFTSRYPKGITGMKADESLKMIDDIRKSCQLTNVHELPEVLKRNHINPTAKLEMNSPYLSIYHYQHDYSIFFILNEDASNSYKGKICLPFKHEPIYYDTWDNLLYPIQTNKKGSESQIEVNLDPLEMVVLVDGLPLNICSKYTNADIPYFESFPFKQTFNSKDTEDYVSEVLDWTVQYAEAKFYPSFGDKKQVDLNGIQKMNANFSGILRYETVIELPKSKKAILKIPDSFGSVSVWINGNYAGTKVSNPFVFSLGEHLKDGINNLRVEVATTLERESKVIGSDTYCMSFPSPLKPIGIIGIPTIHIKI